MIKLTDLLVRAFAFIFSAFTIGLGCIFLALILWDDDYIDDADIILKKIWKTKISKDANK